MTVSLSLKTMVRTMLQKRKLAINKNLSFLVAQNHPEEVLVYPEEVRLCIPAKCLIRA